MMCQNSSIIKPNDRLSLLFWRLAGPSELYTLSELKNNRRVLPITIRGYCLSLDARLWVLRSIH